MFPVTLMICIWFLFDMFCFGYVMLCYELLLDSYGLFPHIFQASITGTKAIVSPEYPSASQKRLKDMDKVGQIYFVFRSGGYVASQ